MINLHPVIRENVNKRSRSLRPEIAVVEGFDFTTPFSQRPDRQISTFMGEKLNLKGLVFDI